MELVETNESEVFADSHLVARKFGYKHKDLIRIVTNVKQSISEFKGDLESPLNMPISTEEEREYRGTKYTSHLMSRQFFSLVVMRMKGKKAFEWQIKFNDAFYQMENRILTADKNATDPEFLKIRSQGKLARREETDVIKEFVEYATNQGSKKAQFYYKHVTNSCYRALGLLVQNNPKLRDTMNIMELAELQLMEYRAGMLLKKYMKLERNYKDIYASVKVDLESFGSGLKLPAPE